MTLMQSTESQYNERTNYQDRICRHAYKEQPSIQSSRPMSTALSPHAERLFPCFKPITLPWSNLTATPRPVLNIYVY